MARPDAKAAPGALGREGTGGGDLAGWRPQPPCGQGAGRDIGGTARKADLFCLRLLKTKDAQGYFEALAPMSEGLIAVSIPGQAATLAADADLPLTLADVELQQLLAASLHRLADARSLVAVC